MSDGVLSEPQHLARMFRPLSHTRLNPSSWNGNLLETLESVRHRSLTVLYNRGNRGDGLIHMGGRSLFASLGLKPREVHEENAPLDFIRGDVLLVYGCGAFCRGSHTLAEATQRIARNFKRIIILPASFDLECGPVRRFVRSWDARYTVFCRELVSYDRLKRIETGARAILLGHDLALHADLSEWAARPHSGRAGIFRRDNEAAYGRLPQGIPNEDASHGTHREPEKLLDYVARFAEIHTDRCHGAISAALMGRRVVFYRNNYFKNQAIYEHSLTQFPNVVFVRDQSFSFRQFFRANYWGRVRPIEMKIRAGLGQRPAHFPQPSVQ